MVPGVLTRLPPHCSPFLSLSGVSERRKVSFAPPSDRATKTEKRDPRQGVEATSMRCPKIPSACRTMTRPMPRPSHCAVSSPGCRVDHVLTVVEDQEDLLVAYKCHETPEGISSLDHETESRGHCGWNELGICQHAQVDKANGAAEAVQQCMCNRNGDGGLADAAWADDADEPARSELRRYGSNSFFSTDHPRQSRRQFSELLAVRVSFRDRQPPSRTRRRALRRSALSGGWQSELGDWTHPP